MGECSRFPLHPLAHSREWPRMAFSDMVSRKVPPSTLCLQVKVIINDRVDVAMAAGADGVHVGQDDMPCEAVRSLVGPDMIIGVSCKTPQQARAAAAAGADYLGVGAGRS